VTFASPWRMTPPVIPNRTERSPARLVRACKERSCMKANKSITYLISSCMQGNINHAAPLPPLSRSLARWPHGSKGKKWINCLTGSCMKGSHAPHACLLNCFLLQRMGNFYYDKPLCIRDGMKMRWNLFVDLLVHERNGYRRFISVDIKYYLSRIMQMSIQ